MAGLVAQHHVVLAGGGERVEIVVHLLMEAVGGDSALVTGERRAEDRNHERRPFAGEQAQGGLVEGIAAADNVGGDVTPVGMTMNRDGKTAFVTLGRANYVAFVDTATRKIESYVPVGGRPRGAVLSADEQTLYVANGASNNLSIVDVPSGKAIEAVAVGRSPHSVQADN